MPVFNVCSARVFLPCTLPSTCTQSSTALDGSKTGTRALGLTVRRFFLSSARAAAQHRTRCLVCAALHIAAEPLAELHRLPGAAAQERVARTLVESDPAMAERAPNLASPTLHLVEHAHAEHTPRLIKSDPNLVAPPQIMSNTPMRMPYQSGGGQPPAWVVRGVSPLSLRCCRAVFVKPLSGVRCERCGMAPSQAATVCLEVGTALVPQRVLLS